MVPTQAHSARTVSGAPADTADAGVADFVAQQVGTQQLRRCRQVQSADRLWLPGRAVQAGERAVIRLIALCLRVQCLGRLCSCCADW